MQAIGEVLYDLISVIDNFWVGSRGLERFFQIKKGLKLSAKPKEVVLNKAVRLQRKINIVSE